MLLLSITYGGAVTFLSGLALGLSLIVAIGAQNVFVLRQGLRKEHVGLVIAICAASDAVLIAAGVSGVGAALSSAPDLVTAIRWGGAAFLAGYGILAAKRAWRPTGQALLADARHTSTPGVGVVHSTVPETSNGTATAAGVAAPPLASSVRAVALTCLALTWLNPHVYLDTVLLLGGIASSHGDARWTFGAGAITGSLVWFTALGYGARLLAGALATPRAWRVLDGIIAVVMLVLAVTLALGA
ncbi:LysE/ArgO family amino acid transporter [Demequina sp. TTPB684]|nr:LysE/ArgO family amino acid transporter [Demequina sp. TMPB413]MCB2411635.1 LysE/ArgO family amino acid transporter [Demequina sp. TTPB684]UPU89793.1 LysE/ArgO family amino acid transporter [Demequina sp. TMPB413]